MKTLKIGDRIKTNFGAGMEIQKGTITAVEVVEGTTDYRGTDYRGKCQDSEYRIVCGSEDGITLENILLDLSEGSYTYSQHSMGGTLFSSFGTCTKL